MRAWSGPGRASECPGCGAPGVICDTPAGEVADRAGLVSVADRLADAGLAILCASSHGHEDAVCESCEERVDGRGAVELVDADGEVRSCENCDAVVEISELDRGVCADCLAEVWAADGDVATSRLHLEEYEIRARDLRARVKRIQARGRSS